MNSEHTHPQNETPTPTGRIDYIAVENSPAFKKLKRDHRSFVFPMALLFLVWYFVYVLLGAYAHDFMAQPVFGLTNMGILLGLLQFVSTFGITMAYVAFANRKLDNETAAIRADLEATEAGR